MTKTYQWTDKTFREEMYTFEKKKKKLMPCRYSCAYAKGKRTFQSWGKRYKLHCKGKVYGLCLMQQCKINWICQSYNHGWMGTKLHTPFIVKI